SRVLRPGGHALITVPAFQSMWGLQDDVSHHCRRYRMPRLKRAVESAGLFPVHYFYFNYLLFLPIWLARHIIRIFNINLASENQVNTALLNSLLTTVFDFDERTAPRLSPPLGVSLLLLVQKSGAND